MEKCVTCGKELHPERAKKYDYCMSRECQEKNAKPLTMVAIGVNKAAEQYMILDEHTKDDLASGKYHDQRRGSFGTSLPSPPATLPNTPTTPAPTSPAPKPAREGASAEPPAGRQTGPPPVEPAAAAAGAAVQRTGPAAGRDRRRSSS